MPCVTVGKEPPLSAVAAVVPEGVALDSAADVACAEDAAADDAAVDVAPSPSGCWIVDNCGKLVSPCASTAGAAASSRPNRPTQGRILGCVCDVRRVLWCVLGYRGARLRGQRVTPSRAAARVSGDEAVGERVEAVVRKSDACSVGERATGQREVERTLVAGLLAERQWGCRGAAE